VALQLSTQYGQNEQGEFADGQLQVGGRGACHPTNENEAEYAGTGLEYAKWCTQGTCTRRLIPSW
jgi:hypothetical protein